MPRVMPLIEATVIPDGAVYGVPQVSYVVEGDSGHDFGSALAFAAFRHSVAIEEAASGYSDLVRARSLKIDELGQVLAILAQANANLPTDSQDTDDKASVSRGAWVAQMITKYHLGFELSNGNTKITRENVMNGQNEVQYAMDTEDNNLQQDVVSLQGLVSKRDNAFSTAGRLVKKYDGSADGTIGNIS